MAGELHVEGLKASAEIAKQTIALATGAIAFTVTFLEKFTKTNSGAAIAPPDELYAAWGLLGVSALCAMWTLMALNGTLESLDRKANGWSLSPHQEKAATGEAANVKTPALAMMCTFLLGIATLILAGMRLQPGLPSCGGG